MVYKNRSRMKPSHSAILNTVDNDVKSNKQYPETHRAAYGYNLPNL